LLSPYDAACSISPPRHPGSCVVLSSFGLEGRKKKKKKLINSSLKNHHIWRNWSMCCGIPVGLPSAEPHAEIIMFKLFRKAIEKQTPVSLGGSVYTLALLLLAKHG